MLLSACNQRANTYFEKKLTYPNILTSDQKVKLAAYVVPTQQQYEWQQLELTAFIHFGMNTFTGREWGDGSESPTLFNPTDFEADQWVSSLQEAGFKMIILTAKHHDGFLPLAHPHLPRIRYPPPPGATGQGDVVKAVKEACDRHKIKFGLYLSPWDRQCRELRQLAPLQRPVCRTAHGAAYQLW